MFDKEFDNERAYGIAREVASETLEAAERGLFAAIKAFLYLAVAGVSAYVAYRATQRTIRAGKVVAVTAIVVHFLGAAAGATGLALVEDAVVHAGALGVLAAFSGYDLQTIGLTVAAPAAALTGLAAFPGVFFADGAATLTGIGVAVGAFVWVVSVVHEVQSD